MFSANGEELVVSLGDLANLNCHSHYISYIRRGCVFSRDDLDERKGIVHDGVGLVDRKIHQGLDVES